MVRYESAHLVICDYFGWGEVGEFEGWLAEIGGCDGGWSILVNKSIPTYRTLAIRWKRANGVIHCTSH